MQNLNGPGKVIFRKGQIADVKCSTDTKGRVWVKHGIGHPDWHDILLNHPQGPYPLIMDDGRNVQIRFLNLEGLVEVVGS